MTSADIIQIITAATAFMVTFSTAVVLIIKELRSVSAKVEVVAAKADAVAKEQGAALSVIHENGNAHLKLMTDKLAASELKNEKLLVDSRNQMDERMKSIEAMLETRRQEERATAKEARAAEITPATGPVRVEIHQPPLGPVPVEIRQSPDNPVPVDPVDRTNVKTVEV